MTQRPKSVSESWESLYVSGCGVGGWSPNVSLSSGLFGEDPASRRERLRILLSARLERGELKEAVEEATVVATAVSHTHITVSRLMSHTSQIDEGVWFHEGPEQLLNARYWIADYSIPRSVSHVWVWSHVVVVQG